MNNEFDFSRPEEAHDFEFRNKEVGEMEKRVSCQDCVHAMIGSGWGAWNPLWFRMEYIAFGPKSPLVRRCADRLLEQIIWCFEVASLSNTLNFFKKRFNVLHVFHDVGTENKIE